MITVFGSINVDLVIRVERMPRPGETIRGSDYRLIPGGKGANQALAARRAGAEVKLIGAVGSDSIADIALAELEPAGVGLANVRRMDGASGMAIVTVDQNGENAIVVSPGANAHASASGFELGGEGDTLLLQMLLPIEESVSAARRARDAGARTILSIAPFRPVKIAQLEAFAVVIVNEHEAADLAASYGIGGGDEATIVAALSKHLDRTVIATLGSAGAVASQGGDVFRVPALPVDVIDTTGAGDAFAGALAAFLDEGMSLQDAMRMAAVAGSLACTRHGAQPSFPTRDEISAAAAV